MTVLDTWITPNCSWPLAEGRRLLRFKKELNTNRHVDNVLSLTLRGVVRNDINKPEGQVPTDYASYQVFERGDLVFKLIDLENVRTSRVGLVPERGIMSPAYVRLVSSDLLESRFAYYWFYSLYLRQVFNQLGAGVRANLTPSELLDLQVVVPPIAKQRQIADFLDDQVARIDNLIAARRSQMQLLESQRAGELDSLVDGAECPTARLALFARIQSGVTVDAGRESADGIDVPYLRVANVQAGALNLDEVKSIRVARSQVARYLLRDGDVLMTEGGDIDKLGRGTVWRSQVRGAIHQNHVFAVRVDQSRLIPEYLAHVTASSTARQYFEVTGNRTTNLASTSATKVLDLRIPVRGIDEQIRIVRAAEEADSRARALKGLLLDSIARVDELKRSLITAAVTGEFDVTSAGGSRVPV